MAEQTFRSPGFFEREIDLTERVSAPSGTPAGVIGTSEFGPAFVPVTVGTFNDFQARFGGLSASRFAPYAVNEWLKNRNALTFVRVLGAGANETIQDINYTNQYGITKNAGFVISGSKSSEGNNGRGFVQLLVAEHTVAANAVNAFPVFFNRSIPDYSGASAQINLVRGVLFFASGSRGFLTGTSDTLTAAGINAGAPAASDASSFKLVISSTLGSGFSNDDKLPGIRVFSCSLDPGSQNYYAKVLNTDPFKFQETQHLLYADFAVDSELASGSIGTVGSTDYRIALVSGSNDGPSAISSLPCFGSGTGVKFAELFGRYDSRYTTPRTTSFISQPYGDKEYDLFHFETISDGAYSNNRVKVSIANLRASTDPNNEYGLFEVQVRVFGDTDLTPQILESFPDCSLNPNSDRYVARIIGDRKVRYDFDAELAEERRLVVTGKYGNQSSYIRVIMNSMVEAGQVPNNALPFGFRGIPTLKTTDSLTDMVDTAIQDAAGNTIGSPAARMTVGVTTPVTGAIVPPLPYRFKVTRGPLAAASGVTYTGQIGTTTRVDRRFYWGIQNTRFATGNLLDPNIGTALNPIVDAYTRFIGVEKMDALVTGSGADVFNDNKFTLARVAFSESNFSAVTDTADSHMLKAAYIRDAVPSGSNYTVRDENGNDRVTIATLINSSSVVFNRFTPYAKFTNIFYGGFNGLNILDKESAYMTDRAASVDNGGYAADSVARLGLNNGVNAVQPGAGLANNTIASYRAAINIMTDPLTVRTNLLAIPGIRDSFVTDYASDQVRSYSLAAYLMDIPSYSLDNTNSIRLFGDAEDKIGLRPDATETAEQFDARAIDNNYVATYFPDVTIVDPSTGRFVTVPSSVAALGALGYNDSVSFPWFAPAGFNRASLDFVKNVNTRLLQEDRDTLYNARINPIANFPVNSSSAQQYVIFGQKTLQQAQSALDRVNVRRLLLEVKRIVSDIAINLLFEQNDVITQNRFVNQVVPQLAAIAAQQGIERFQVICDESNNSALDVEQNRMNGRITLVPTRAIEFVAVDFVITNSGISFE